MKMTKRCGRCGETKPKSEFHKNAGRLDGLQTYCKDCHSAYRVGKDRKYKAAYYARNADRERERAREKYWRNPETYRAKSRKENRDPEEYARYLAREKIRRGKIRDAVFTAYGGYVCACCGERNDQFLTIDHIDGCGGAERRRQGLGQSFYAWLRKNGFPPGFQVLCYNCNLGRAKNDGVCPHNLHSA